MKVMAVLSPSLLGICLLLLPAAIVLQLTSAAVPATLTETDRRSADTDRFYQEPDVNSAEEGQRDLAYLKQVLDEKYQNLETASKQDDEAELRRKGVQLLRKILSDIDIREPLKKKRTCKVNLGGNCATEDAVSMADHWHFLSSALSPGRRRRRQANSDSSSSSSSSFLSSSVSSIRYDPSLHPFALNRKRRVSSPLE